MPASDFSKYQLTYILLNLNQLKPINMKKFEFLVVKNPDTRKDIYIKPESIDQIISGVMRMDPKTGRPIIGGNESLCSVHCKNGLAVIVSLADAKFLLSHIAKKILSR